MAATRAARSNDSSWKAWYWTARWRRIAKAQLAAEPLCARCLKAGLVVPATVSHHVVRHQGDPVLFWTGKLESVCKPGHDGPIQAEEARGHVVGSDARGRPVDPTHPWNRGR